MGSVCQLRIQVIMQNMSRFLALACAALMCMLACTSGSSSHAMLVANGKAHLLVPSAAFGKESGAEKIATGPWGCLTRAAAEEYVTFSMALFTKDSKGLKEFVDQVSDPRSSNYGRHMSPEELTEKHGPIDGAVDALQQWRRQHLPSKMFSFSSSGDVVRIAAKVKHVERVFGISLRKCVHKEDLETRLAVPRYIIRTSQKRIPMPEELEDFVHAITGLNNFPVFFSSYYEEGEEAAPPGAPVSPTTIKTLYSISDAVKDPTAAHTTQGVAAFGAVGFSQNDLNNSIKRYGLQSIEVEVSEAESESHMHVAIEGNLDVQYLTGVAQGIPTMYRLQNDGSFDVLGFLSWVVNKFDKEESPRVWSMSYGEAIESVDPSTVHRTDVELQKLAAMGVSVMAASGDAGVYSRNRPQSLGFSATYPASLPHCTAVGATFLNDDQTETNATAYSGGGFTNTTYYTRAESGSYQSAAVEGYLNSGVKLPSSSLYNSSGLGFPDVAALGNNFEVFFLMDAPVNVCGTSASCPTFSAIVSLLNEQRQAAGKSSLGWLNPWLYQNPGMFHDIVNGDNNDRTSEGFLATKGWDPVTGLGTPNYEEMKASAMKLQ